MFSITPRIHPERHTKSLWRLRNIYGAWQDEGRSWHEADTICLCIIPVLHLLNFPTRSIRQTVQQIKDENGLGMKPDFSIRIYGNEFGIIEAKKASTELDAPHGYLQSQTPVDQTLRYFDQFAPKFAITSNGLEWIVFRKAHADVEQVTSCYYEAIRTNLEHTIRWDYGDLLDEFLYNFDYYNLMQDKWPVPDGSFQKRVRFDRKNGPMNVLMHDFSWDNKYVGF